MTPHCPTCQREMRFKKRETTYGLNHKAYEGTFYVCPHDDTWVTVEVPKVEEKR